MKTIYASGSGLDPRISAENALAQVERVAQARKMSASSLREIIEKHIEGPQLGVFGERVVNVLVLNLDLDRIAPVFAK